jgi:hypothetical protein
MKQLQTVEDVYPAIAELIAELKLAGHSELAEMLHHRMYQCVWTTRSELFEELKKVLANWSLFEPAGLPQPLKSQTERITSVIDCYLNS